MSGTFEGLNPPYRTIVADPPWSSNNDGSAFGAKGMARVARYTIPSQPESRYSTLPTADICALPVSDLAAKNAHLYLWVTCSGLDAGLAVMETWGFTYKTTLTWIKRAPGHLGSLGLGAYFRTQTEHVLFGVRGSLATMVKDQRNFFEAARGRHSQKPAAFADIVERCSPGPYVELFARSPRLGWDAWGKGYESEREAPCRAI